MKILGFGEFTAFNTVLVSEDSNYPAANVLTEYPNEFAKSTERSDTFTASCGTCRDICIVNTNANSGNITVTGRASRSSGTITIVNAEAMTFTNRNYYRDLGATYYDVAVSVSSMTADSDSETISDTRTYYADENLEIEGDLVLETGADVTINGILTIKGSITINGGSITVNGTLNVEPPENLLEIGAFFTGVFNSFGSTDTVVVAPRDYSMKFPQDGDKYDFSCFGKMNDYQQLSKYLLKYADNRFLAIPDRTGRSGVVVTDFMGYGKATLQNTSNNSHIQEKWTLTLKEKA